jgi:TolB-like protein/Tfp pilus assembly protein PilF
MAVALRLRALGTPSVSRGNGPLGGTAAQRKSLALLSLLAPAGERGLSRDKIVAYLWPESPADRAAHRLTQLLYSLRRDLAADRLFIGAGELRLNSAVIESDVAEFYEAVSRQELERAVAAYGGPFLDGFFLSGAPEFERWVDAERANLAERFAAAIEELAIQAARAGDPSGAAAWWRRVADGDPLNARVVASYIECLAAAGDRAAAQRAMQVHEARMREELGAPPDPAVVAALERSRQVVSVTPVTAPASVAVLPFVNLSPERENEYFADGMTEELTNALARVPGLRVAARTSAFAFKGRNADAREIGQCLRVGALVEGSVRKVGNRIRITAQLVSAEDGYHLWSETYERTLDDVFLLQEQIARAIASALPLGTLPPQALAPQPTSDIEAYTLYLRGRFFALRRTAGDLHVAVEYLEQAVERDPDFALAHAGLGECWVLLGFEEFGDQPPLEAMPRGRRHIGRALEIDAHLAEAHAWAAVVTFLFDWDWPAADAAFRRVLHLKPAYSLAHAWYAVFLSAMGRSTEAIAEALHAVDLDPMALNVQVVAAKTHYDARRYDEAIARLRAILDMDPTQARVHDWLARALALSGRPREALEVVEQGIARAGRVPLHLAMQGSLQATLGRRADALGILAELQQRRQTRYISEFFDAPIYRNLGQFDACIACYERLYEARSAALVFQAVEPSGDRLRSHPRFQALLQRMRLDTLPAI